MTTNKNDKTVLKRGRQDPEPSESDEDEEEDEEEEEDEWSSCDDTEEVEETTDSSYVPSPKNSSKTTKKRTTNRDPSSEDESLNESEEKMSTKDFKKLMYKMFPSKHTKELLKKCKESESESESSEDEKPIRRKSKRTRNQKRARKVESESESDEDYDDDEEEEEEKGTYNIILSMGNDDDYDDDEDAIDEDEECNSDDEKTFMKETYEPTTEVSTESVEKTKTKTKTPPKRLSKKEKAKQKLLDKTNEETYSEDAPQNTAVESEYQELVELKKQLTEKLLKKPTNKILKHAVTECSEAIKTLVQKSRNKNAKKYIKLMRGDGVKQQNEVEYFRKSLSNKEQLQAMKELNEINKYIHVAKPYRLILLDSNIPPKYKATVMQKLNILKTMEPGDPEYYKIKNWVDTFMRIPFGVYKSLTVKMTDGMEVCSTYMENAKHILDDCVYGLDDAKLQILQMVGQWIANPDAMGTAIAIKGPPGTGKTSLIRDGISKILGREFAFIALGGATDSAFLEGHSYTYEGSSWGKIAQILIDSKCMNPVFFFDELDKVSDTAKGDEIIGILTHLTDTSQNSQFHDKYFTEIDFDLSKALFIFSYNDESKINPILKDRMYRIQTKGYETAEKVIIANKYLLPKIREQVNFSETDIIIPDETLRYIITNKVLTQDEMGVRNLKRCLEIIHTKLNLYRLVKPEMKLFGKDAELTVTFPYTVSIKDVDILIKNNEKQNQSILSMYV